MSHKMRLFRAVYGGGVKGGPMSEATKLAVVRRLSRMLVRVVLGKHKMAEFDRMMARWDAMTPTELAAENVRLRSELQKHLDTKP